MRLLFCALLLLCTGCRTYNPDLPPLVIPHQWKEPIKADSSIVWTDRFWEVFNDPVLNRLEEQATDANFDLQIAASRILEARALVTREHGARLPHVDLSASFNSDETLINPRYFGSPVKHLERVEQRQYTLLAGFAYEVDLWGKLKAKEQSALSHLDASVWEYAFVYQTIVTDVAIHYISLRILEEELALLKQSIGLWQDTVSINNCKVEAGLDPEVDLSRAKLELARVQAEEQQVYRRHALLEHALATLLGEPASTWTVPQGNTPLQLPKVPEVLPSEVVKKRPDIQRQMALLSAGRSDVDAALREFFPSIPLTASVGLAAPFLSDLLTWQARYWSYLFSVLQPLFDGNRRKADVEGAKARFATRFASYQKSVVTAFQDVEDALASLHYLQREYEAEERATEAAKDTVSLGKEQFTHGLISYLLVADIEKTALEVEKRVVALKGERILAWIGLMKAFGSGTNKKIN
jgi:multidrug efflux system outer membrane protein